MLNLSIQPNYYFQNNVSNRSLRSNLRVITNPSFKGIKEDNQASLKQLRNSRPLMLSKTNIDVEEWLNQFDCEEDKQLILKILDNYVYIDMNNARKAFKKVYQDISSRDGFDVNQTKFATLGVSKSGSVMGYLFRHANKFRSKGTVQHKYTDTQNMMKEEKFLTSTQLSNPQLNKNLAEQGFKNLVIVDDMIGDGDSLVEYFTPELVESLSNYEKIYYATLLKDPDGEEKVKREFPNLNIEFVSAMTVHKYDSKENTTFTPEEKVKIAELVKKYCAKINPALVDKYGRSKLFISFDWNTPGNTPMFFNLNENNWKSLFPRYNGLEKDEVEPVFSFIC